MKKNIIAVSMILICAIAGIGHAQNPQARRQAPADSSSQFADRIVNSQIPVVVDFWAAWCMPCRWLDPIIHELEKEYSGRVMFMKVDIDIHHAMAAHFRVNSVPYVFIIEDKTVRTALPGVRSKQAYVQAIEDALKLSASRRSGSQEGQCTVNC